MKKLLLFLVIYPLAAVGSLWAGAVVVDLPSVGAFFFSMHPLVVVATIAVGFAPASYLLGAVTGDYSWVDRLWSTAPVLFAWIHAVRADLAPAPTVAALLVSAWGLRLTYNFARRGGYTTMEDYRWPILRNRMKSPLVWQLFNLLFICGYQILLFVLFTMPVHRLATISAPLSPATTLAAVALFLLFLAYETVADQQQWVFQNVKHGAIPANPPPAWMGPDAGTRRARLEADLERGFLTHGLFRYSRHPNYFGELAVWWTLYLLAVVASGELVQWSGLGVLLLTLLFVGSTWFTESISGARYPRYTEYRQRTSAIVPWLPGGATEQVQEQTE
ncbi:MAG: DUF1295 domain-containing protein [Spirochaetota bacterium]